VQIVPNLDAYEWNTALASIPNAHVLQTWQWGELKSRYGWTPARVLFVENGTPRAAAQILRRAVPRTPFGILYVPKGPALDYEDSLLFEQVLASLEQYARRSRAIFLKLDPDVRVAMPAASVLTKRRLALSQSGGVIARMGWYASNEQIQFHNTVMLDLSRSEDDVLAGMKPKWRYNIRLAQRKGVSVHAVEIVDEETLRLFYELYAETSARDGFLIRQFPYYRDVWHTMLTAHLAQILLARFGDETVAGLMLFVFARKAWYFYGASRNTHRELMPNHLLQWEAMRWAKAHGCAAYDFWGAPDRLDENEPMYGVYKFKLGFGGEFVERIPAHDFVVNPALYWLYAVARPRYLARLRRRHDVQTGFEG
jgi:lipid II:glycine glycyltransferase (peptidoglycan interpeptide bridge formation enzyme)